MTPNKSDNMRKWIYIPHKMGWLRKDGQFFPDVIEFYPPTFIKSHYKNAKGEKYEIY